MGMPRENELSCFHKLFLLTEMSTGRQVVFSSVIAIYRPKIWGNLRSSDSSIKSFGSDLTARGLDCFQYLPGPVSEKLCL